MSFGSKIADKLRDPFPSLGSTLRREFDINPVGSVNDELRPKINATFAQLKANGATPGELRRFSLDTQGLENLDHDLLTTLAQEHLAKLKARTGAEALAAGQMFEGRVNLFDQLSKPQNRPFQL